MMGQREYIGLFDVLSEAMNYYLPMEHQTYDETYSINALKRIKLYCSKCLGERALFYHVDGRKEAEPKLVKITGVYPYFLEGKYCCYDPEGEFRCYLTVTISYVDLYCRSSRLEILGDV